MAEQRRAVPAMTAPAAPFDPSTPRALARPHRRAMLAANPGWLREHADAPTPKGHACETWPPGSTGAPLPGSICVPRGGRTPRPGSSAGSPHRRPAATSATCRTPSAAPAPAPPATATATAQPRPRRHPPRRRHPRLHWMIRLVYSSRHFLRVLHGGGVFRTGVGRSHGVEAIRRVRPAHRSRTLARPQCARGHLRPAPSLGTVLPDARLRGGRRTPGRCRPASVLHLLAGARRPGSRRIEG